MFINRSSVHVVTGCGCRELILVLFRMLSSCVCDIRAGDVLCGVVARWRDA